jgi:hypothetical protein
LVTKALREGRLARGCAAGASGKQERREIDLAPFLEGAAPGIMTNPPARRDLLRSSGRGACAAAGHLGLGLAVTAVTAVGMAAFTLLVLLA